MKKYLLVGVLYFFTFVAMILGIYSQGIVKLFPDYDPNQVLIILIVTSVILFFVTFLIALLILRKQKAKRQAYFAFIVLNFFAGVSVSMWSIFVLMMWFGQ